MEQIEQNIKKALYHVQRPGRYWGNELNLSVKNREETDLSFALAFPDLYEIGMSHVGFSILYHVLNKEKWIACERVYSPWPDMEEEMLNRNIPLFSLETKTPVKEFDILGITLQYELQYTNVLNLIHLSGIPVHSSQRTNEDPIIIAGGPCSNNPEPLSMFIDVFAIGDGEEVAVEIAEKVRDAKKAGLSRKTILSNLADIPGLYVPAVHRDTGKVIKARIIEGIKEENYSEKPIVPVIDVTHDRFSMEVMRGCTRGCRFCAAGISYRPVRERDPDKAFEHARKVIENTGYEEISLVSLSTSDYSGLPRLLTLLTGRFNTNPVSIAFPSLRPETFTEEMAEIAADIRKTSLTLAPEAGSQRMRDIINKGLTEEDILLLDLDGNVLEGEKEPTSEKQLHLEIHRSFPQISVVLHAHPPFTVGFFEVFEKLNIFSFEAKFYLGDVKAIPQSTPIVSDTEPIIKHLENSNIVVLKNHGVVSVGKNFRESFSLIELLEQQCKVNLFLKDKGEVKNTDERTGFSQKVIRRYKLLSEEHINKLVRLVNNDPQLQELGKKYNFTCSLAVKDKTTGKVVCFYYKEGRIVKVDSDAGAEFVIVGDSSILKKIFNREIDPFVASTQGKIKTEGDFTKCKKETLKLKGMSDNMRTNTLSDELVKIINTSDSEVAKDALEKVSESLVAFAKMEGLDGHANAVQKRKS